MRGWGLVLALLGGCVITPDQGKHKAISARLTMYEQHERHFALTVLTANCRGEHERLGKGENKCRFCPSYRISLALIKHKAPSRPYSRLVVFRRFSPYLNHIAVNPVPTGFAASSHHHRPHKSFDHEETIASYQALKLIPYPLDFYAT